MEDILRQLRENPDILPVVSLPPAGGTRPAADSLSPNRLESSPGSVESTDAVKNQADVVQPIVPVAATVAAASVVPAKPVAAAAAAVPIPLAAHHGGLHVHSRSTSLDGGDVCPAATDSAVSATLANPIPTTNPNPMTVQPPALAPLSISNHPVVAVTVDGATPPVVAIPAPQFPQTAASQSIAANAVTPANGGLETTEPEPPKVF